MQSSSSTSEPNWSSSGLNLSLYGGATENELLLIAPYMYKYDPKNDDHVIDPDEDENTKFLRQVRQSKGYEINVFPGEEMNSPFYSISPRDEEGVKDVKQVVDFAIDTINKDSGENYKLLKVVNAVLTRTRGFFVTFTAEDEEKETDDPDRVINFRAMVYNRLGRVPEEMRLMEYKKLFPDGEWKLVKVLNTARTLLKEANERKAKRAASRINW